MKEIRLMPKLVCWLMLVFAPLAWSFTPAGGDLFVISVNGREVIKHYPGTSSPIKVLQLDGLKQQDEITVRYYHCGTIGKERKLKLISESGKALNEWEFSSQEENMGILYGDIKKAAGSNEAYYLGYSSREMPRGVRLVKMVG